MAFSFGQIGSLVAVSQLVYGRIAVAIRPYGKWNTGVRHLVYGLQKRQWEERNGGLG